MLHKFGYALNPLAAASGDGDLMTNFQVKSPEDRANPVLAQSNAAARGACFDAAQACEETQQKCSFRTGANASMVLQAEYRPRWRRFVLHFIS